MDLRTISYLTANYAHLQGLRLVPLGLLFLAFCSPVLLAVSGVGLVVGVDELLELLLRIVGRDLGALRILAGYGGRRMQSGGHGARGRQQPQG